MRGTGAASSGAAPRPPLPASGACPLSTVRTSLRHAASGCSTRPHASRSLLAAGFAAVKARSGCRRSAAEGSGRRGGSAKRSSSAERTTCAKQRVWWWCVVAQGSAAQSCRRGRCCC